MLAAGSSALCALTPLCTEAAGTQGEWECTSQTQTDTPSQTSGAPCLWAALSSARLVPLGRSAAPEAEGTANVHVTMRLMAAASPHFAVQAAEQQETTTIYIYIYIATLCLSRGAVLHRLLCAFSLGDYLAFAFSSGPPRCL